MVLDKILYHIRLLTLLLASILLPIFSIAKWQGEIGLEVLNAFKTNNAKSIADFFGENVSLSIKNDSGYYSKFQAEVILADYFRTNKTSKIKQVQRTNRSNNNFYIVYQLKSPIASYRVFVKFNQVAGQAQIIELRIE